MSKQEKLISEEQLDKKLAEKISMYDKRIDRRNGPCYFDESQTVERLHSEAYAYEQVVKMIDMLTIKPGAKKYRCCACKGTSTSIDWNNETGSYLGILMHFINLPGNESDTFVCPKCGEEQPRHMVEVVKDNRDWQQDRKGKE